MRRWMRCRVGGRLLAGLLVTVLLLAFAPTASAAATLTANPTVVTVSFGNPKGKTTLTWNSGGAESIQVFVRIDDGPFAPTGLAGPAGAGDYANIEFGKTYLFRLFAANGQPLASSPVAIVTVKRAKIKLDFGCLAQCIEAVDVEPHGTYADVHVETNEPATFVVQASTATPNADGSCKTTELAGTLWKPTQSTTFDGQLVDLDAGTTHCLTVTAKDAAGNESKAHRTFKTHRRFATVTIGKIFVNNDSDPDSSGEILFDIHVHTIEDNKAVPETSLASGQSVSPNKQYTVADAPTAVKVTVRGVDDDGPFDTWEVAKAEAVLDVVGPGGPDEVFPAPKPFEKTSSPLDGSDLKFKVSGTFSVTYAP